MFGLARNSRLVEEIAVELIQAADEPSARVSRRGATKTSAGQRAIAGRFRRRVIAKAEWTRAKPIRAFS